MTTAVLEKFGSEVDSSLNNIITLGSTKVVVSPEGEVAVYTDRGTQTKHAAAANGNQLASSAYGVKAELAGDNGLIIYTNSPPVIKHAAAYDVDLAAARAALVVGAKMRDGTIYAGISPTTQEPMYAAPADAPKRLTFNKAAEYADALEVGGKNDFRMPDQAELDVLYKNRNEGALAGTFNEAGSITAGWFWSSTPDSDHAAWSQRFSNGGQVREGKGCHSSVRCIR